MALSDSLIDEEVKDPDLKKRLHEIKNDLQIVGILEKTEQPPRSRKAMRWSLPYASPARKQHGNLQLHALHRIFAHLVFVKRLDLL